MGTKVKKSFYKKWWFWLIVIIFVIGFASSGEEVEEDMTEGDETVKTSSEEATVSDTGSAEDTETKEDLAEETDSMEETNENSNAEEDNVEEQEEVTRNNSSAEETMLNTGSFIVGEEIPSGRYVITGDGNGNLFVYDGEMPVVNEILDPSAEYGVKSVTTDLEDGQEIEISGINEVTFTPAETNLSNSLTTGTWEVGLDIEAGRYDVTTDSGSGNFFVYSALGIPEVNEILDASGEFGVPKVTVNLDAGQIIEISGLNEVVFESK